MFCRDSECEILMHQVAVMVLIVPVPKPTLITSVIRYTAFQAPLNASSVLKFDSRIEQKTTKDVIQSFYSLGAVHLACITSCIKC
jgi:hypothetical protein